MVIQAVKKFIGRDRLLDDYEARLRLFPKGHWRAVLYYGQSGIGKTDLRRKLASMATQKGFAVAEWDVRDLAAARPERVLSAWQSHLRERGATFPGFESVYASYIHHVDPGRALVTDSELMRTPGLKEAVQLTENVPVVSWLTKSANLLYSVRRIFSRRSVNAERNLDDRVAAAESADTFIDLLVEQFALDLTQWSQRKEQGVVLFLDRFDVFGATDPDAPCVVMPRWLESLIGQSSRLIVTMFSQRPAATTSSFVESIAVPLFNSGECDLYLDEARIADPFIRTAMKDLADGLPFGLATAVGTAQKHRGSVTPDLFKLDGSLAENIYSTLAESLPRKEVLDVLSVPRLFDREIASTIFTDLGEKFRKKDFDGFVSNRFVDRDQNGIYSIHSLLRNAANARFRANDRVRFHRIHKVLFDKYRKERIGEVLDDAAFRIIGHAIYHGAWSGAEDDFAEWLHETDRMARYTGRYSWLAENYLAALSVPELGELARAELKLVLGGLRLKTKAEDKEDLVEEGFLAIGQLRPGTARYAWALIDRGEMASNQGAFEQAMTLARQARELFEQLPDANYTGLAIAINNEAFCEGQLKNDVARLEGYKRAMTLAASYSLPDADLFKSNYAQALASIGELDEALRLHRENADLRKRVGRLSGLAVTRSHIAEILALKGEYAEALAENNAALDMHRGMKRVRKILAAERLQVDILLQMRQNAEARALADRALETSRRIENSEEIVESLYWLGRVQLANGGVADAGKSVLEALAQADNKAGSRIKGELRALRAQVESKKSVAAAIPLFHEAFKIGFRNVHTRCLVLSEYAEVLCAADRHDEACAALQQCVAISEVLGLASHRQRLDALRRERPHAKTPVRWEKPTDRIKRIDSKYDELLRAILLTDYEKALNRDWERSEVIEAYRSGRKYNPRFTYESVQHLPLGDWFRLFAELDLAMPLDRLYNELIYDQLRAIHRIRTHDPDAITASTEDAYGWPDQDLRNIAANIVNDKRGPVRSSERVDAAEARRRIEKRLAEMSVADRWRVELDENLSPRLLSNTRTNTISIRASLSIPADELDALVLHEVDVHVSRAENGARQPLSIFATGLPGYLMTEEGLAVYAEFAMCGGRIPRRIALRILAAHHARELGFFDIFAKCVALTHDEDLSFDVVARVKRGFNDASRPGAHLKDTIYLRGVLAVRDLLNRADKEGSWRNLFAGKIGVEHLPAVAAAMQDGWIQLPLLVPPLPDGPIVIPISRTDYEG
jgi:Tfp pilus assembly protein PilF